MLPNPSPCVRTGHFHCATLVGTASNSFHGRPCYTVYATSGAHRPPQLDTVHRAAGPGPRVPNADTPKRPATSPPPSPPSCLLLIGRQTRQCGRLRAHWLGSTGSTPPPPRRVRHCLYHVFPLSSWLKQCLSLRSSATGSGCRTWASSSCGAAGYENFYRSPPVSRRSSCGRSAPLLLLLPSVRGARNQRDGICVDKTGLIISSVRGLRLLLLPSVTYMDHCAGPLSAGPCRRGQVKTLPFAPCFKCLLVSSLKQHLSLRYSAVQQRLSDYIGVPLGTPQHTSLGVCVLHERSAASSGTPT